MHRTTKTVLSLILVFMMMITSAVPVMAAESVGLDEATYDLDNELPVIPVRVVSELTISTYPKKEIYQLGEELDVSDGEVTIKYDDGTTKTVKMTSKMVVDFDNTKLGSQNVTVAYEGKTTLLPLIVEVGLYSKSVVLKDTISMRIYYNKPISNIDSYELKWKLDDAKKKVEGTVNFTDMTEKSGLLRTDIPVAVREIGDVIQLDLYKNDSLVESQYYSVAQYCKGQINNPDSDDKLKSLCKCLLDYATYMQIFKEYRLDRYANETNGDSSTTKYTHGASYYTTVPSGFVNDTTGAASGISIQSKSIVLDSVTNARIYFTLDEGETIGSYKFECDNKELTPHDASNKTYPRRYYVNLPGFAMRKLNMASALKVTKIGETGDGLTLSYSVLAYAYGMQNDSEDLGNVLKSMYQCYLLALAYFGE